jgi:hypothetical protein
MVEFINYCVVIMGETEGAKDEIGVVSENEVKLLDQKGIVIATFKSVLDATELSEFFKDNGRNFLLFNMSSVVSGFNIMNEEVHKDLFGDVDKENEKLIDLTDKLFGQIKKDISNNPFIKPLKNSGGTYSNIHDYLNGSETNKIVNIDYETLTDEDRESMINEILDKGFKNLTKKDKETLKKLNKK